MDVRVLWFLGAEYKFTGFLEVNAKIGRRFPLALTQNIACCTGSHPPQGQAGVGSVRARCFPTASLSDSTAGLAQVKEATDSWGAALPVWLDIILQI